MKITDQMGGEDHRPNGRRQSVKGIDYLTMYVIIYTSFLSKHFWPCTLLWYTKWNNSEDAIAMKVAGELKLKKKRKNEKYHIPHIAF